MKLTMNKQMTTMAQVAPLKDAMKDFKARYTDGDLRTVMNDYCSRLNAWEAANALSGDIIRCDVDAFPNNSIYFDKAWYAVEMVIGRWGNGYTLIRFYVDQNLNLDERPDLITMKVFEEYRQLF